MRYSSSKAFPNRNPTMQKCSKPWRRPTQGPGRGKTHSRRKAVRSSCRKISIASEKKRPLTVIEIKPAITTIADCIQFLVLFESAVIEESYVSSAESSTATNGGVEGFRIGRCPWIKFGPESCRLCCWREGRYCSVDALHGRASRK